MMTKKEKYDLPSAAVIVLQKAEQGNLTPARKYIAKISTTIDALETMQTFAGNQWRHNMILYWDSVLCRVKQSLKSIISTNRKRA